MVRKIKELLAIRVTGEAWVNKAMFHVKTPLFPILQYAPVVFGFSVYALWIKGFSFGRFALIFVAGLALWTLAEYCLHRFLLHDVLYKLENVPEPWNHIVAGFHPAHHDDTKDPFLLIAPPVASILVSSLFFGIFYLILWDFTATGVLMSGLLTAYVFYEWVHYGTHFFKWKKFSLGRYYKRYHLYHHFKGKYEAFGVTGPLWDHVFGTPKAS